MTHAMSPREAAAGPARKRRTWRVALIGVGALLLAGGILGAYAWFLSSTFDTQTEKISEAFPRPYSLRPPVLEGEAAKAQNILLLGSDTGRPSGGSVAALGARHSDSVIVVHIPADRAHIYVLSILRDSWVDVPGHGQARINAALSLGGVPTAVATIEGLLGARMDHVAIVDFTGFRGVTDALGGVDIDNPVAFSSSRLEGRYFKRGTLHVNGTEALAFVRERHAFRDGDFQRTRNQQAFMKALMTEVLSAGTLTDPGKVSGLVGAVAPFLAVDPGLNSAYLAGLALELRETRADDVTFFTAPAKGTAIVGEHPIVKIDPVKFAALREAFTEDTLDAYLSAPQ
ncbi:LCP family protein [Cryobacterium tagatosivorans]|uniref:LCP family protein n=1 Tax=Cryobacterium tagatosivorans TaxID=1259199 RepID=UPI00141ABC01|nr:LCP family protein [Cryobacterium tagatosivorans]